mmetsp:Transcript_125280/g.354568  ORF Transcript_125280/g.354568 Transcript_125280/m.354568 type:complete len:209 (-) Transcript_125280:124-750(-)
MAVAFTCATSSPAAAFAANMASRNARDFNFHFGTFSPPPAGRPRAGRRPRCPFSFSSLCALATSAWESSKSPSRFAALSNCLRRSRKTFLQTFACFSKLSLTNLRPQSGQGTRGMPLVSYSSGSTCGLPPFAPRGSSLPLAAGLGAPSMPRKSSPPLAAGLGAPPKLRRGASIIGAAPGPPAPAAAGPPAPAPPRWPGYGCPGPGLAG